jgi:hypothetical protein
MDTCATIRRTTGCGIDLTPSGLRGYVGPGLADEVQECYRAFVTECLHRRCTRALIVGRTRIDAFYHLALRDALRAMSLAGVPPEFRIALVAETPDLIAVYDAAVVEAGRHGIDARRFPAAADAERWLAESSA